MCQFLPKKVAKACDLKGAKIFFRFFLKNIFVELQKVLPLHSLLKQGLETW